MLNIGGTTMFGEENTNTDIFDAPKRRYAKYENPTTVRVGGLTKEFLKAKEMPLSYLVKNAPRWHERALEAEEYKTNMNRYREQVIKLQGEVLELMDWKKRATERLKKRNLEVEE